MKKQVSNNSDPLLKIVEKGLEVFIKNQCNSISNIKLKLNGNSLSLLRGKIQSLRLNANTINYKNILLNEIELYTEQINFDLKIGLNSNNFFQLKDKFKIHGSISFRTSELNTTLKNSQWEWLRLDLVKYLCNSEKLIEIAISEELLSMKYLTNANEAKYAPCSIKTNQGKVLIINNDTRKEYELPMDPLINIQKINISRDMLKMNFFALVKI